MNSTPAVSLIILADGSRGFAGSSGSNVPSFMMEYPGKTLQSFKPKSLYQACYLSLKNANSLLVKCTIRVTTSVVDLNGQSSQEQTVKPASYDRNFSPPGGVVVSVEPTELKFALCQIPGPERKL